MKKIILSVLSATIILSPLYILRVQVLIPTTFLEWLIAASVLLVLIDYFRSKNQISIFKTKFDLLILFFLIAAVVATVTSFNLIGGLGILKAYFVEPVLFYYCLVFAIRKYKCDNLIINSLLIAALWLGVLGLIQKLTGSFSLAPNEIAQGRVSAVYNSANSLALFIGPVISLGCALFLKNVGKRKMIFGSIFVFLTLIMLWTKSRGGIIAELFSLVVFVYAVASEKIKLLRKTWLAVPVLIIFLVSLSLYQTINAYRSLSPSSLPYRGSDTLEIRYYLWQGTANMIADHPILGAGLDGFKTLYSRDYKVPQYNEDFQYPHNIFLTFWTETGIFGLAVFLGILLWTFTLLLKSFSKGKNYLLSVGLLSALTYWIIHGVVDVPYFKNDLSLEFWVIIALVEIYSARLTL